MDDITTITTSEAVHLLGCSERTLRRRLRKAGIEPVVVGQGPSEQNRYDRACILALGGSNGHDSEDLVENDRTYAPLVDLSPVMSAIKALEDRRGGELADVSGQLAAIADRLTAIEDMLNKPPKRRHWWFW